MDIDLRSIAIRGVFSAGRAARLGIDGTTLRQLVKAGQCHPLHRGWYTPYRPKNAREHFRLRTIALLNEYGDVAVASHGSAVVLLGLPTEAVDFGTAHLMWTTPDTRFEAFSRVRIHERLACEALPMQIETVHPAVACLQVGLGDPRSLMVAADAALRAETITPEQLVEAGQLLRGQRGLSRARAVIRWCDARHESAGESVTAFVLKLLGYALEPQFATGLRGPGGGLLRSDFLILGTTVLVEFDGLTKYQARDEEEAQRLLFAEKLREDALRDAGYEVVRLTWADLQNPELVRAKIEAAIARTLGRAS
ncbi:MAG: hypothetical protein ACTHJJ_11190 [Intrasporangium sp.]|uniref:hypothetical protein n=1 Tax=Intrasporangium sp. TaxID=1925024 RepID=UPI003F7EF1B9